MTVLSGITLRATYGMFGGRIVEPFCERTVQNGMSFGVSHAGYDIRINNDKPEQVFVLEPGESALTSSLEYFDMPLDVIAVVHDKSTWARRGLAVQNTVIEPGWRGYLTLELTNHGDMALRIDGGDPIAQILFHRLDQAVPGYAGKYQDQQAGPQEARFE